MARCVGVLLCCSCAGQEGITGGLFHRQAARGCALRAGDGQGVHAGGKCRGGYLGDTLAEGLAHHLAAHAVKDGQRGALCGRKV